MDASLLSNTRMWRVLSDSEGMQDRTVVRVSVVPPDFISLLCSGAWLVSQLL